MNVGGAGPLICAGKAFAAAAGSTLRAVVPGHCGCARGARGDRRDVAAPKVNEWAAPSVAGVRNLRRWRKRAGATAAAAVVRSCMGRPTPESTTPVG